MPIEERDLVYEVEDLDENNKVRVLYYKKSEIENQIANFEILKKSKNKADKKRATTSIKFLRKVLKNPYVYNGNEYLRVKKKGKTWVVGFFNTKLRL